jgi:hypothetical protein
MSWRPNAPRHITELKDTAELKEDREQCHGDNGKGGHNA